MAEGLFGPSRYASWVKTLGVDFGEKRIGLAISDPRGRVAVPSRVLTRTSDAQAVRAIRELVTSEAVERVVLGLPLGLDGEPGDAARRVRSFARKLRSALEVPLMLRDEALTSVEAQRLVGRRAPDRPVDAIAAQILLQEVLDEESAGA